MVVQHAASGMSGTKKNDWGSAHRLGCWRGPRQSPRAGAARPVKLFPGAQAIHERGPAQSAPGPCFCFMRRCFKNRQTNKQTNKQIYTQTDKQTNRQNKQTTKHKQANKQTNTNKQTNKKTDRKTNKQTQTNRQTDRQTAKWETHIRLTHPRSASMCIKGFYSAVPGKANLREYLEGWWWSGAVRAPLHDDASAAAWPALSPV